MWSRSATRRRDLQREHGAAEFRRGERHLDDEQFLLRDQANLPARGEPDSRASAGNERRDEVGDCASVSTAPSCVVEISAESGVTPNWDRMMMSPPELLT